MKEVSLHHYSPRQNHHNDSHSVKHFPFLSTSIFLGIVVLLLTSLASLQSWHKHLSQFLTTDSTALVQDTTTMGYTTCHSSLTGRPPRPKVSTLPSNYLPQHGFNPISPHITTNTTVIQHLQHYFGTQNMPSLLYFITPTYRRHTQMADLLRLSYTLDHDLAIYWIVVEDADHCSLRVRALLEQTPLSFAHVYSPSPTDATARGVSQRNRALQVVEQVGLPGVVYFGDDDNAYDVRMFPELRRIQKVGVFGVGYAGGGTFERCIVNPTTGKVAKFVTKWEGGRLYPVDMAGLVFSTKILRGKRFSTDWTQGYLETKLLQKMITSKSELEPLMDNCTRIYVWHVKTKYPYDEGPYNMDDIDPEASRIFPTV